MYLFLYLSTFVEYLRHRWLGHYKLGSANTNRGRSVAYQPCQQKVQTGKQAYRSLSL